MSAQSKGNFFHTGSGTVRRYASQLLQQIRRRTAPRRAGSGVVWKNLNQYSVINVQQCCCAHFYSQAAIHKLAGIRHYSGQRDRNRFITRTLFISETADPGSSVINESWKTFQSRSILHRRIISIFYQTVTSDDLLLHISHGALWRIQRRHLPSPLYLAWNFKTFAKVIIKYENLSLLPFITRSLCPLNQPMDLFRTPLVVWSQHPLSRPLM